MIKSAYKVDQTDIILHTWLYNFVEASKVKLRIAPNLNGPIIILYSYPFKPMYATKYKIRFHTRLISSTLIAVFI